MRLWTMQKPEVWGTLKSTGVHSADTQEVYSNRLLAPETPLEDDFTITAYRWLSKQMISRVGHPPHGVEYPVWAWKKRPDLRSGGYGMPGTELVMIEVEIPEEKIILTDFSLWAFPYSGWAIPHPHKEYLQFCKDLKKAGLNEYSGKKLPPPFHSWVEKSWELVFDLNCKRRSLTSAPSNKIIQACLWEISIEMVKGVRKVKCR